MKKTITSWEFIDAFDEANRSSNFSEDGREALFEYFEQLEQDTGEEIELDVIAVCCDYTQYTYTDFAEGYGLHDLNYLLDDGELTEDEFKEQIEEYINDRGVFIKIDDDRFICSAF